MTRTRLWHMRQFMMFILCRWLREHPSENTPKQCAWYQICMPARLISLCSNFVIVMCDRWCRALTLLLFRTTTCGLTINNASPRLFQMRGDVGSHLWKRSLVLHKTCASGPWEIALSSGRKLRTLTWNWAEIDQPPYFVFSLPINSIAVRWAVHKKFGEKFLERAYFQ